MAMEVASRLLDVGEFTKMAQVGILKPNEHLELIDGRIILVHTNGEQRQFTVDEYYKLAEVGLLNEDDRVELIDGEIVEMSPIGSRHAASVTKLSYILRDCLGNSATISTQNPVRLHDNSEPVPDIAILKPRDDFYAEHHPAPPDVLLLIEVADSSVHQDRERKIPVYARARIPEVWLYDLNKKAITQYSTPQEGRYRRVRTYGEGETIQSVSLPSLVLDVSSVVK